MNRRKGMILVLLLLFLAILPFVGAIGFESLYAGRGASRGMLMYFVALVALLAVPLLNRYLKVIAFYIIAFTLTRGLMRITDEQDPFRALFSIEAGLKLGLQIVVPLVALSMFILALAWTLKRAGVVRDSNREEIVDYMQRGRRKGKTLGQLKKELTEQGVKEEKINNAIVERDA